MPETTGHVDLHSHTTASDGSFTPAELIAEALRVNLAALAITDHDTFDGYEQAIAPAEAAGLRLIRGIELNSRLEIEGGRMRFAHILAYFPAREPSADFVDWIQTQQEERRDRNQRLIASLQNRGIEITLPEIENLGRSLAGRPHFAKVLVKKGYASSIDDAFGRYLKEGTPTYVERETFTAEQVIAVVRAGGGIPVVAHPIRLNLPHDELERDVFIMLKNAGLLGLEVIHSEHDPEMAEYYGKLASELDLLPTGGSDFHGTVKPDVGLGAGRDGNVCVPVQFLDDLSSLQEQILNGYTSDLYEAERHLS